MLYSGCFWSCAEFYLAGEEGSASQAAPLSFRRGSIESGHRVSVPLHLLYFLFFFGNGLVITVEGEVRWMESDQRVTRLIAEIRCLDEG